MRRIDTPTAAEDLFGPGKDGFRDGNPALAILATRLNAAFFNALQEEVANTIELGGLALDPNDNTQLFKVVRLLASSGAITSLSADTVLTAAHRGLVLVDASGGNRLITLPASNAGLGVVDVIVRRVDNGGSRLKVQAAGGDKIKFHTHLSATGYPFLVLMGAGDWWHLRSDGAGGWWPIGRHDSDALGRPVFESTSLVSPGGWGVFAGSMFNRADWPWLWDHAQQSGMLTTEAARVGMEGGWTSGDGALTFRGPEGRGEFLRLLDEGRGVDPGRALGSSQADSLKAHSHNYGATHNANFGMSSFPQIGVHPASQIAYQTAATGGSETRPRNIAYPGRIKLI